MGYTSFTVDKLKAILSTNKIKTVIDLGAQNMYNQPKLPAPYAKDWYEEQGYKYTAIDLCGENGSLPLDLAYPIKEKISKCDLLVDAGTSEHVGINGAFAWEAIYNCWLNKHNLLKTGGIMVNENPETGSWPGHGFQWYTKAFYDELVTISGYEILETGRHAAMGNITDGWNTFCTMKKTGNKFATLQEFKTLDLLRS